VRIFLTSRASFSVLLLSLLFFLLAAGCGINVTTIAEESAAVNAPWKGEKFLPVKNIQQLPELPSGCEITSAAIVLNYHGCKISKTELASYFQIGGMPRLTGGIKVGPDPWKVFAGDPQGSGYGCFAPVVTQAVTRYLSAAGRQLKAVNLSGTKAAALIPFINAGIPVIVWATISMKEPYRGDGWILEGTGKDFRWPAREHCLVLIGYSGSDLLLSDPLDPQGTVLYSFSLFEKRYRQLHCQAVVVEPA
jgi:uncharacterized protein YvpB